MIKGTFTLDANTTCKFHVGDLPKRKTYTETYINTSNSRLNPTYTKSTSGTALPKDDDGDSYVWMGNPSYILMSDDINAKLTKTTSIVAVKAQGWYISTGSASNKNRPYGWNYWEG